MKHLVKLTITLLTAAALTLSFTACNDSSSSSAATGPSSSGFAGSTININPSITFIDATNCTYTNTEVGSPFPASASPTAGTYTYTPGADFKTGVLTLVIDAPVSNTLTFNITSFTQSGGNVSGFRAEYNGRTFPVTVTGGTIIAQVVNNGGGNGVGETSATDIPATMQGTYDLVFFEAATGSNIPDGTITTFTINARTLVFGAKTLTNPVFRAGNTLEWIFKDGSLEYAASIAIDQGLNEINVGSPGNFLGQYKETSATTTVTDGELASGTILIGTVSGNSTPIDYPASAPTLTDGDSITFNIGDGTATFGSYTGLTFDSANSNEFSALYTENLGNGESNQVRIAYQDAGGTTYVNFITVSFFRKVNPADGQAKRADYFIGELSNP